MTQPAANLRVRRTQKLLREALIELVEERGFDALTVAEITERAMVSRAAFYRNYKDKYDLMESIFVESMQELSQSVGDLGQEHPTGVWVTFFEHIAQYERLFRALLGKQGSLWFVTRMRASLVDLIRERGQLPHSLGAGAHPSHSFSDDFVPNLVATLFMESITWWLEHGMPYPPQEIARRSALLAAAIFQEASSWN